MTSTEVSAPSKMRGVIGLANLGNTCYQNATLQALRHCPEWTLFCAKGRVDEFIKDKPSDSKQVKVLEAYKDVMKSLWAGTGPAYVLPRGFFEQIRGVVQGTLYESFAQRSPQDAHEFLIWILDQMYMATQREVSIPVHELRNSEQSMRHQALVAWKGAFEKQHSPLTDLLFGLFRIQYTCHSCKAVHTRWETFNCLKVTPRANTSLYECIEQELQPEEIQEYACDACKEKTTVTKRARIWKLPKVLILTVKRFDWQGHKVTTPIEYSGEALQFESIFPVDSQEDSKKKSYKCFAVVDHHGGSLGGGHYTAQCFNSVWKTWHHYDDESAHELKEPRFGSQSYILFFRQSVKEHADAA